MARLANLSFTLVTLAFVFFSATDSSIYAQEQPQQKPPFRPILQVVGSGTDVASMEKEAFVALIRLSEQLGDYKLSLSSYDSFEWATTHDLILIISHRSAGPLMYDGPVEKGFRALLRRSDLSLLGIGYLSGGEIPKPKR